jgi:anti-sigma factor RsiW
MASIQDCKNIQAGLSEYIDEVLPSELHEATRVHLRSCAVCTKIAQELSQTSRLLALMPRSEPTESFEQRLATRLAGQALRPKPLTVGEKLSAWWIRPRVRPALASGLALAALVPVVILSLRPASVRPILPTPQSEPVAENTEVEQVLQEHLSARSSEAFGDSSSLLLASVHSDQEPGS